MSEFIEFIFGVIILGLMLIAGFSMLSAMSSKKPMRKRRNYRSSNRYYKGRGRGYGYYQTPPITSRTPRKFSGKSYISNPHPNTFMVYFLENERLGALKLGVGSWGRINEFLDARVEPSHSAEIIGWKLLRAAKFSTTESQYDEGREQAYEAEKRAHFYWRYVKRYSIHLTKERMGYSLMNVEGVERYGPTKGYTETAQLGEVCETTTWNFVIKSPGFKEEVVLQDFRPLAQRDFENISLDMPPGYLEANIKRIRHGSVKGTRAGATEEERIWAKVNKTESCWLWIAAKTPSGYGFGVFEGKGGPAHRIVWKLEIGSDPGLYILDNVCGTRSCVNPMHWSLSLKRRSKPGEVRVSSFSCSEIGCNRPSRSMIKSSLCEPCRQRAKRQRRKARRASSNEDREI